MQSFNSADSSAIMALLHLSANRDVGLPIPAQKGAGSPSVPAKNCEFRCSNPVASSSASATLPTQSLGRPGMPRNLSADDMTNLESLQTGYNLSLSSLGFERASQSQVASLDLAARKQEVEDTVVKNGAGSQRPSVVVQPPVSPVVTETPTSKTFDCPIAGCGRRFARYCDVHTHMKSHERRHLCPLEGCGKSFKRAEHLRSHLKTHSNERPHFCPSASCGKTFKTVSGLRYHINNKHPEKAEDLLKEVTGAQDTRTPPVQISYGKKGMVLSAPPSSSIPISPVKDDAWKNVESRDKEAGLKVSSTRGIAKKRKGVQPQPQPHFAFPQPWGFAPFLFAPAALPGSGSFASTRAKYFQNFQGMQQ
mmetsp:Transcript_47140/g.121823  ORF Transcript_47140/g.121823 Transcript_47140/m.121823 type:complete len:364 (+) Transcript_47140:233-1324(+)